MKNKLSKLNQVCVVIGLLIGLLILFHSTTYVHAQDSTELINFFNEKFILVENINIGDEVVVVKYRMKPLMSSKEFGEDMSYIFGKITKEFPNSDIIRIECLVGEEIIFEYEIDTKNVLDYVNGKLSDDEIISKIRVKDFTEQIISGDGDITSPTDPFTLEKYYLYIIVGVLVLIILLLLIKIFKSNRVKKKKQALKGREKMKNTAQNEESQTLLSRLNFGIVSPIIAVMAGVLLFALIVVGGIIDASTPGGMSEESPIAVIIGLLIILGLFVCMVGAGFGIVGLFQKNQNKTWAILGLILNVSIILVFIGLIFLVE